MTEQRLVNIELKVLAQEDLMLELSHTVYLQQKEIAELRAACTVLAQRLSAGDSGGGQAYGDEKPPHY